MTVKLTFGFIRMLCARRAESENRGRLSTRVLARLHLRFLPSISVLARCCNSSSMSLQHAAGSSMASGQRPDSPSSGGGPLHNNSNNAPAAAPPSGAAAGGRGTSNDNSASTADATAEGQATGSHRCQECGREFATRRNLTRHAANRERLALACILHLRLKLTLACPTSPTMLHLLRFGQTTIRSLTSAPISAVDGPLLGPTCCCAIRACTLGLAV